MQQGQGHIGAPVKTQGEIIRAIEEPVELKPRTLGEPETEEDLLNHPRHPGPEEQKPEEQKPQAPTPEKPKLDESKKGIISNLNSTAELNDVIANPEPGQIIVYSASYCAPCHQLENTGIYDQIAEKGFDIKKFDVQQSTSTLYSPVKGGGPVNSIPHAVLFNGTSWQAIHNSNGSGFNGIKAFAEGR